MPPDVKADAKTTLGMVSSIGLASVLVMYLLGMFPFLPSPLHVVVQAALVEVKSLVVRHIDDTKGELVEIRRAAVMTCRALWRDRPSEQADCGVPR